MSPLRHNPFAAREHSALVDRQLRSTMIAKEMRDKAKIPRIREMKRKAKRAASH